MHPASHPFNTLVGRISRKPEVLTACQGIPIRREGTVRPSAKGQSARLTRLKHRLRHDVAGRRQSPALRVPREPMLSQGVIRVVAGHVEDHAAKQLPEILLQMPGVRRRKNSKLDFSSTR